MKTRTIEKAGLYIGATIGVVLFAVIGFLTGSFIGGVLGLKMAAALFGAPVPATVAARLIVAASMMMGIAVAGIICVVGTSLAGWVTGKAVDAIMHAHEAGQDKTVRVKN